MRHSCAVARLHPPRRLRRTLRALPMGRREELLREWFAVQLRRLGMAKQAALALAVTRAREYLWRHGA